MCRKIGVEKKVRVQNLQQYSEKLQEFLLGILNFLTNQEEVRQQRQ